MKFASFFGIQILLLGCNVNFGAADQDTKSGNVALIPSENSESDDAFEDDVLVETETAQENFREGLKTFEPSKEWKDVEKGQPIPQGLHVRLNLATGKTEAKLLDESEQGAVKDGPPEDRRYLREELLDAMQHFTSDDVKDPKKIQVAEKTFKNIDQLKKDFDSLKMNVKTDNELMAVLMDVIKRPNVTDADKINSFNDLEYYVHQFDNAQDFVKMGGFPLVIPSLNSTDDDVRAAAAFLLGSAMQSNPKVQIEALENTLLQYLLRLIVWDSSPIVRNRAMYALSTLVRHFPLAQKKLVELGGLAVLTELFRQSSHSPELTKLQVKAITLITDLIDEKQMAAQHLVPDDELQEEKHRQYEEVNLENPMVELEWCKYIPRLLEVNEHDVREKVVRAMMTFVGKCGSRFQPFAVLLEPLLKEYCGLSVAEEHIKSQLENNDDYAEYYFTDLCETLRTLKGRILEMGKDEL